MKTIIYGMGFMFCFYCSLQAQQQVKRVIGWGESSFQKGKIVKLYEAEYNQAGQLLREAEPEHHCEQTFTYDKEGRVQTSELFCGESFVNGTTFYTYTDTIHCRDAQLMGYIQKNCDYLNQDGKITHQMEWHHMGWETYVLETHFFYNKKGQVIREEQQKLVCENRHVTTVLAQKKNYPTRNEIQQHCPNAKWIYTNTIYTYNYFDSLTNTIILDGHTGHFTHRTYCIYDDETHQLIEKKVWKIKKDHILQLDRKYQYQYDKLGRLTQKQFFNRNDKTERLQLHNENKFLFKNKELWQTIHHYHFNGDFKKKTVEIYQNGRRIRKRTHDLMAKNQLLELIDYEYKYW